MAICPKCFSKGVDPWASVCPYCTRDLGGSLDIDSNSAFGKIIGIFIYGLHFLMYFGFIGLILYCAIFANRK